MSTPPATSGSSKDLAGRVCVVTGGNTGIGRATALALARRGARLVLACRSADKTQPVLDELRALGAEAEFVALDLGSLAAVRRSAAELLARNIPIHVLVNNAGLAGLRGLTTDGFEIAFGTNHLGTFLYTTLLLDRIRESAPARIVTVASTGHYSAKGIDWDAIRRSTPGLTGLGEYAVSKLANVLFSAELARRLTGTGVTTYSLHPGAVASDVWRQVPWPVRPLITLFMKSNEDGARTSVHCAASPEAAKETGLYYTDCRVKTPSRIAQDLGLAAELWRRSEAFCAAVPGA